MPVIAAVRGRPAGHARSAIDTTKAAVAAAALDAGADLVNDVWGVGADDALARLAAARRRPAGRHAQPGASPSTATSSGEVVADLRAALERAIAARRRRATTLIVDPGIGFGKTAEPEPRARSASSTRCAALGRPILLGTSRKSTLGKVLDLPADQRLEATLATTALGIADGADIVRVHDVARQRPGRPDERRHRPRHLAARGRPRERSDRPDEPALRGAARRATTGSATTAQPFEVDVELVARPPAAPVRSTTSPRRSTTASSTTRSRPMLDGPSRQPAGGAGRGDRRRAPDATSSRGRGRGPRPQAGGPARRPARPRRASRSDARRPATRRPGDAG